MEQKGQAPEVGTRQWIQNEKTINRNKVLRDARDISEGFRPKGGGATHGGKGSSQRPTNKELYDSNYDRIFGKKDK